LQGSRHHWRILHQEGGDDGFTGGSDGGLTCPVHGISRQPVREIAPCTMDKRSAV